MEGFLVIDKPAGITSHDVVATVRAVTGLKKVGHTGTLDPFATGVLPLALGGATKLIRFLDESVKVYDATIALGAATDTGDLTGEVIQTAPIPDFSDADVDSVLASFTGDRLQTPPAYSAVKKDGKALYKYAREGKTVTVPPRPITVYSLSIIERTPESLRVLLSCSRGTYARVLGDDIATALGSRGHLRALRRDQSGPFMLEGSLDFEQLGSMVAAEAGHDWREVFMGRKRGGVRWRPRDEVRGEVLARVVSPLAALSHLPRVVVEGAVATAVRNGAKPPACADAGTGERYAVVTGGELLAVAENGPQGGKSLRVLA